MATAASKKYGLNKHFCQVLIALSPGLQKLSLSIWRIQSCPNTHCLPQELFDDHEYSIPASPLPHSYASLPCLLSHTHFLAMGQLHAEVSPGMNFREGFAALNPWQGLFFLWVQHCWQVPAGWDGGKCSVPEQGTPSPGQGGQQQQLPPQHCSMGSAFCAKPWENTLQSQCLRETCTHRKGEGFPAGRKQQKSQSWPQVFAPKCQLEISLFLPPKLSAIPALPQ